MTLEEEEVVGALRRRSVLYKGNVVLCFGQCPLFRGLFIGSFAPKTHRYVLPPIVVDVALYRMDRLGPTFARAMMDALSDFF